MICNPHDASWASKGYPGCTGHRVSASPSCETSGTAGLRALTQVQEQEAPPDAEADGHKALVGSAKIADAG